MATKPLVACMTKAFGVKERRRGCRSAILVLQWGDLIVGGEQLVERRSGAGGAVR